MDGKIQCLNTDLDLMSADDVTALASALEALGVFPLHVTRGEDALWFATFETSSVDQPEQNVAAMITAIESLPENLRAIWSSCRLREFNIGCDCGDEPWAFNQGMSNELLCRIAAVGASLRITIYPDRDERTEQSQEPQRLDETDL